MKRLDWRDSNLFFREAVNRSVCAIYVILWFDFRIEILLSLLCLDDITIIFVCI